MNTLGIALWGIGNHAQNRILPILSSSKEIIVKFFSNKVSSSDLVKKNRVMPLYSNALSDILFPKL